MLYRKWLFLMVSLLIGTLIQAQDTEPSKIIVGYYPAWAVYGREYFVSDIPADKLTHISYAFATISESLECASGDSWADIEMPFEGDAEDAPLKGNFHQLQLLKQKYPHLKTLIAVGGWSGSVFFSDAALTPESREKFVASCVKFMKDYGFDGIEVDWSYPTGVGNPSNHKTREDPRNFILLLEEFRKQLDTSGQTDNTHYLLTIAAGSGFRQLLGIQWRRAHTFLDWLSVTAYDFSGPWSEVTGFNAPLYYSTRNSPEGGSVNTSMVRYINAGVPRSKLLLGVPFYGHSWTEVPKDYNGLHQVPGGESEERTWESSIVDYRDVVDRYLPTMTRFWSRNSRVPWLYSEQTGLMITYDDVESVTEKANYVNEQNLGGVIVWDLSSDTDNGDLVTALWNTLMTEQAD